VGVTDNDNKEQNIYETFYVSDNKTDYGYRMDIPKEKINGSSIKFEIVVENEGKFQIIKSVTLDSEETRKLIGKKVIKRKIVSKEKVYDCDGSGHGYYVITWSDGEIEYEDF